MDVQHLGNFFFPGLEREIQILKKQLSQPKLILAQVETGVLQYKFGPQLINCIKKSSLRLQTCAGTGIGEKAFKMGVFFEPCLTRSFK